MNKHLTAILIALLALMLAGIVFAVSRLYRPVVEEDTPVSSDAYPLLRAVPMDAVAVFSFDGGKPSRRVVADSTGLLRTFLSAEIFPVIQHFGACPMAVSLHNSGMLVPLVAVRPEKADSLVLPAGLKSARVEDMLLISSSETLLGASQRHIEEKMSVLGTEGMARLCARMGGGATVFLANQQASKLLQMYAAPQVRQYASVAKHLADWMAFHLDADGKEVLLQGTASVPGNHQSFFAAFYGLSCRTTEAPAILPYDLYAGLFLPFGDIDAWVERRRDFEDAWGRVRAFDREIGSGSEELGTPVEWARSIKLSEVDRITLSLEGEREDVLLLKTGKDAKPSQSPQPNPYQGYVKALFGPKFALRDSTLAFLPGKWVAMGPAAAVRLLMEKPAMSLKDRLDDARVSIPSGLAAYGSLSDCPSLAGEYLALEPARGVERYTTGAACAPVWASMDLSGERPALRLALSRRMEKGEKMETFLKDTTVIVPTGLFPVTNSQTGQTNYLYQNEVLSICLKDENGKGVWGIPFHEPICGAVENIDYFQNGKIQFLFAAGSSLYLLDRLGRFVKGFPVDLHKEIRLGPKAFDLSGAGGYNVLVLHKDNTIEMYNLHGQKPSAWNGIRSDEVFRSLPELLTSGGKHYWKVLTSGGDRIYGFYGGEPLSSREMAKIEKSSKTLQP